MSRLGDSAAFVLELVLAFSYSMGLFAAPFRGREDEYESTSMMDGRQSPTESPPTFRFHISVACGKPAKR